MGLSFLFFPILHLTREVLEALPTSFGKSLMFQLTFAAVVVFNHWREARDSLVIGVLPLKVFMRDQIMQLNRMNVRSLIVRFGK